MPKSLRVVIDFNMFSQVVFLDLKIDALAKTPASTACRLCGRDCLASDFGKRWEDWSKKCGTPGAQARVFHKKVAFDKNIL